MSVRRILPLAAVLGAASLLLAGCFPLPGPRDREETVTTHTDETVDAALERYYTQSVTWTDCTRGTTCTTLAAPIDWADPSKGDIEIAISRHAATGGKIGSLLVNPGGPGGSGFDYVRDGYSYFGTPEMLERFDFIGFDPRGVGRSTPITCLTDDADRDEMFYGTYDAPYGSPEWEAELDERQAEWVDACVENTGELLAHIDTFSVARDMDMIRAVLGDEKLNYLGYSYGTYVGTVYAELFPEKVGRMVLDGAVKPPFGGFEELATQMAGFDSAFRAYMQWCLSGSDCPFSGPLDRALTAAHDLAVGVDGRGLRNADGRLLDSATVGTGIALTLYDQGSWYFLSDVFAGLQVGDPSAAFAAADSYNGRNPGGGYSDSSLDVYFAVNCAEGSFGTDDIDMSEGLAIMRERAPIVGEILAYDDYALLESACSQWPHPAPEIPARFDAAGAPPILVIGTSNDPATPYANAIALAKELSSGVLLSYQGEGHTVYGHSGVSCIDDVVDAYFIRGEVPSADPRC